MNTQPLEDHLDSSRLVATLIEKTKAGRVKWEDTADENVFIASVGGKNTLELRMNETDWGGKRPKLSWRDENGKLLLEVETENLYSLFELARRIALSLDERMEELLGTLQAL